MHGRWMLLLGVLGLLAVGISPEAGVVASPARTGTPSASPIASPAAGRPVVVKIIDTSFVPGTITVSVGTTVTWINEDSIPHTATGDHNEFDSSILDQGDRYSYTFTKPGTYDYFCKLHPDMLGRVTVVR